ncbi:MAG: DUF4350 domain-containing protein [Leptolyngbyaceae cyanobacterium MAG.088]|nr:DUF4350 domain-containing protein [Leptolyngbyaceae cyanobacterium MAG.088]
MTLRWQSNRYIWLGLITLVVLCFLLVIFAPSNGIKIHGSTYSRAPEGYLGWYQYMQEQGSPVQRWQRPPENLLAEAGEGSHTLLQIYSGLVSKGLVLSPAWVDDWLAAGNTLVVLGIRQSATEARFKTNQSSDQGDVVVMTRRRHRTPNADQRLGDRYGAVVWQQDQESGTVVLTTTPHLAANAYRSDRGNYAFLANLVTETGGSIWVDEFLHGYKAPDAIIEEAIGTWEDYLSKTPIIAVVIQLGVIMGVFILAQNRRLGPRTLVKSPIVDNSQAYIDALAAVLHKAGSTPFLIDAIAKAEHLNLKKSLGLGPTDIDDTLIQGAWTQHTGQDSEILIPLLKPPQPQKTLSDSQINQWLANLQQIRQQILRFKADNNNHE